jgi:hypothetical protein
LDTWWRRQELARLGVLQEPLDPGTASVVSGRVPVIEKALYVKDRFERRREAKPQIQVILQSPLWGQRAPQLENFDGYRSFEGRRSNGSSCPTGPRAAAHCGC